MAATSSDSPRTSRGLWVALGMLMVMTGMLLGAAVWVYVEWREAQNWRSQAAQMSTFAAAALQDHKALDDLKLESQRERVATQKMFDDLRADMQRTRDEITARQPQAAVTATVQGNWDPQVQRFPRRIPRGGFVPAQAPAVHGLPAKRSWGPEQATGQPDTLVPGDAVTAWASRTADGEQEWLQVEFAQPANIAKVRVYETYNPGALVRITVVDDAGNEAEAWSGKDPTAIGAPMGVSIVSLAAPIMGKRVKLYIDSPAVPGWNEIDAVGIEDERGNVQYAANATASSTWAAQEAPAIILDNLGGLPDDGRVAERVPAGMGRDWGTEQATGAPNVQAAGDDRNAWASRTQDGQPEWLILEYEQPMKISKVKVFESYNPGALNQVSIFNENGKEVEVWKGKDPTPMGAGRGTSTIDIAAPQLSKRIKIYLDSQNVPGWNEIDAVGIEDEAGKTQWAVRCIASSCYAEPDQPAKVAVPAAEQF